jgi:hypothetical protein
MAMQIGDAGATAGMAKAIFDEIENQLSGGMSPGDLANVRPSWKKLAFAIATGVINHIKSNMEIFGIQSTGPVTTTVTGTVSGTTVTGSGTGNVTTNQTAVTTGKVR